MPNLLAKILTRSFPGKAYADKAAANWSADSVVGAEDSAYDSRAFALWSELLLRQASPAVLDLGPARTSTLAYLGQCSERLSILALDPAQALPEQLSAFRADGPFAAVLAWDLLNYMASDAVSHLGQWLAQVTVPGAPLFLSLATQAPYADRPGRYRVCDSGLLQHRSSVAEHNRKVLLPASELAKLMPSFESVRSFLLRSGVQEHVLRRRS